MATKCSQLQYCNTASNRHSIDRRCCTVQVSRAGQLGIGKVCGWPPSQPASCQPQQSVEPYSEIVELYGVSVLLLMLQRRSSMCFHRTESVVAQPSSSSSIFCTFGQGKKKQKSKQKQNTKQQKCSKTSLDIDLHDCKYIISQHSEAR